MAEGSRTPMSPDISNMPPLELHVADVIETLSSEAGMPPLRLSDIMTSDTDTRVADAEDEDGTPVDSQHEVSAPPTATAGWELHVPDHDQRPVVDTEAVGRLRQEICVLDRENQLLRLKLHVLQRNSNLKQLALIGTVISWFGDNSLLEEDADAAYRLTSVMLSASSTEPERVAPSLAECDNNLEEVPWKEKPDGRLDVGGTTNSSPYAGDERPESRGPNFAGKHNETDATSEWMSQSLDSPFNPPLSSSKKEVKTPTMKLTKDTLLSGDGPRQPTDIQGTSITVQVGSQVPNKMDTNLDSFDKSAKRLDTRIRQMDEAVHDLGQRHADTKSHMARLRQNAVRRFRVWKAIAASRKLAAVDSSLYDDEMEEAAYDILRQQLLRPTPLTQHPLDYLVEEANSGPRAMMGGNPSWTILGEIAFQVERRILAFIFQRREILYGYNLGNLDIMIRTQPDQTARSVLKRRYDLLMDVLRSYGWIRGRHPHFVAEMMTRYGTFQDVEMARAVTMSRGWHNPSELKRGVLCLCPVAQVLDMLVIVDCLLHMARGDGLPVFLW